MRNAALYKLILILSIVAGMLVQYQGVYAEMNPCTVQITRISITPNVEPGQNVQVNTHLTISCTGTTQYILARVDLSETGSANILSRSSVGLGLVETHATWNITLLNRVQAPLIAETWNLTAVALVFAGTQPAAQATQSFQVQVTQPVTVTTSSESSLTSTLQSTSSTSQTSASTTSTPQTTSSPFGSLGVPGIIVAFLVASFLFLKRRKRSVVSEEAVTKAGIEQRNRTSQATVISHNISTGYSDLDELLGGGLPEGYAVLVLSQPCDELDSLIRKMMQSVLAGGYLIFFVSRDIVKTQDLVGRYHENFYAFSSMADKTAPDPHIFKIAGVENLSDLNISLTKAIEPLITEDSNRIMILDIISDAVLEHKGLTTRKWLSDFIVKRKAEGFTILGTFNPDIVWKADAQAIIDLFDGVIEIVEKRQYDRARRFLVIKRMYGRKYKEHEIALDRDKLF